MKTDHQSLLFNHLFTFDMRCSKWLPEGVKVWHLVPRSCFHRWKPMLQFSSGTCDGSCTDCSHAHKLAMIICLGLCNLQTWLYHHYCTHHSFCSCLQITYPAKHILKSHSYSLGCYAELSLYKLVIFVFPEKIFVDLRLNVIHWVSGFHHTYNTK